MIARQNPGFVGNARSVGAEREIVAAGFNHPQSLAFLLLNDVAEDTAFLADEIFASGAQLVEHAPRDEHGRGDLRRGMAEFLAGILAIVFEQADVLDARVALEVENALGGEAKEVRDLIVAGIPQMPVVARIFDQHFMRAHRMHAVINSVAAAARLALDAVERRGMHDARADHGTPGALGDFAITCSGCAESAQKRQADSGRGPDSAGSSPVMTQERVMGSLRSSIGRKENTASERSQLRFRAAISTPHYVNAAEEQTPRFVIIRRSPPR